MRFLPSRTSVGLRESDPSNCLSWSGLLSLFRYLTLVREDLHLFKTLGLTTSEETRYVSRPHSRSATHFAWSYWSYPIVFLDSNVQPTTLLFISLVSLASSPCRPFFLSFLQRLDSSSCSSAVCLVERCWFMSHAIVFLVSSSFCPSSSLRPPSSLLLLLLFVLLLLCFFFLIRFPLVAGGRDCRAVELSCVMRIGLSIL